MSIRLSRIEILVANYDICMFDWGQNARRYGHC